MKEFKNISGVFIFDSKIKGPVITIFGGIHGDEISGVKVVDYLKDNFNNGKIKLLKGKVILAYGNEEAIKKGTRQINYNLNRIFKKKFFDKKSDDYEVNRVKELKYLLDNSDVLLDIHSTSSKSEPFMFAEDFQDELKIGKIIGTDKIIIGWEKNGGDMLSGDTNLYMHSIGKIAFTLECGQHKSPDAFDIGLKTSLNLLKYFNLIDGNVNNYNNQLIVMYKIKTTKTGNFLFKDGIDNFKEIKKGELIGFDGDTEIIAEEDFIILLPNYGKTKIGEEVFYYGKYK
ncbi:succinylglutamate desuccinylase/aspartoacylase family protein [Candidatus Gracilibacteria bacterium]|nr:succinylglutamate desuccinylase/aspartoacylase family protein [Candidatus Gracilibacteria bacterium]